MGAQLAERPADRLAQEELGRGRVGVDHLGEQLPVGVKAAAELAEHRGTSQPQVLVDGPPPELQQLLGAMRGNQEAMDGFVSVQANTLPAPEFFGPENVGRIMGYVLAVAAAALLSPPDGWAPGLLGAAAGVYVLGLLGHEQQLRRSQPVVRADGR